MSSKLMWAPRVQTPELAVIDEEYDRFRTEVAGLDERTRQRLVFAIRELGTAMIDMDRGRAEGLLDVAYLMDGKR